MTKSRNLIAKRRFWSGADLEILRTRYPHEPTKPLAVELGRDLKSIYVKAGEGGKSPIFAGEFS